MVQPASNQQSFVLFLLINLPVTLSLAILYSVQCDLVILIVPLLLIHATTDCRSAYIAVPVYFAIGNHVMLQI